MLCPCPVRAAAEREGAAREAGAGTAADMVADGVQAALEWAAQRQFKHGSQDGLLEPGMPQEVCWKQAGGGGGAGAA